MVRNAMYVKLLSLLNKWISKLLYERYGVKDDLKDSSRRRHRKKNGITVTDHALIRYFERMEGYDIDRVMEIITKNIKFKEGVEKYTNADMTVVCDGKAVITLYRNSTNDAIGNKIKGLDKVAGKL